MFFKSTDVKKETKKKIDLIYDGKNLEELIINIIKYSDVTLAVAPADKQNEFICEFNSHKSKNNRIKKSVYEMEEKSVALTDYIIGHKDYIRISKEEYQELLKYKEDHQQLLKDSNTLQKFRKFKLIGLVQQEQIKEKAKTGISQRALATEFNTNVATINKIINNKY